jgi:hypothetical protein
MSNKLQILRTSVAGKSVPAGTYPPGTPWVNFADMDFGIVDAAQIPQSLLGLKVFMGTANYAIGDVVIDSGKLYRAKRTVTGVVGGVFNISDWDEIGAAGATVIVGSTAPATPKKGDLWYDDTKDGRTYVWDGTQWVDAAPASNLGISAFDTTQTYALNDQVIQNGKLYVAKGAVPAGTFQPTQWNAVDDYVQKAGDTMTGKLTVPEVDVTTTNPAKPGLTVKGAAGQTSNYFLVKDAADNPRIVSHSDSTRLQHHDAGGNVTGNIVIASGKGVLPNGISLWTTDKEIKLDTGYGPAAVAGKINLHSLDVDLHAFNTLTLGVGTKNGGTAIDLRVTSNKKGEVYISADDFINSATTKHTINLNKYGGTVLVNNAAISSSKNIKTNIHKHTEDALPKFKSIEVKKFNRVYAAHDEVPEAIDDRTEVGLIAEDVQTIFGNDVAPGGEHIMIGDMLGHFTKAIQELTTRLEALEAK